MKQQMHKKKFESILHSCHTRKASDIHISGTNPVVFRVNGVLTPLSEHIFDASEISDMAREILSREKWEEYKRTKNLDFSYALENGVRFRINLYFERGETAFAIRRLESSKYTLEQLGLPPQLDKLGTLKDGLVLFTGPTGSGKSTSLAAIIDQINTNRSCHILTIEDPVEYVHNNKKSLVHQRELGIDVHTFSDALRAALREDPDVILVGEMRDLETIRAAVTAAETGHLVFSTLHTNDTVGVVDRIIASYPAEEQSMVQRQLASTLRAVVAQRLLPSSDGKGRVAAIEVLLSSTAISNLIRSGQSEQIYSVLETSASSGMQSMDNSLASHVNSAKLDKNAALPFVRNKTLFNNLIEQGVKPPVSRRR